MREVLYLEADEDITAAIDRLLELEGETVQIVVPKRSTLLQSIVNQKLLKKAAADAHKDLVLVTTDRTATHLAGRVGLAVAPNLKSEAVVPETQQSEPETASDIVEGEDDAAASAEEQAAAEAVAAAPASESPAAAAEPFKRRELDAADGKKSTAAKTATAGTAGAAATAPLKKIKGKVPDFNALQKRLLIAGGILAVLVLAWLANFLLAKAVVTLHARGEKIQSEFDFAVDPGRTESNLEQSVLAGRTLESNQTLQANFTATGRRDVGTKAKGQMTVYNSHDSNSHTIPAGSKFTAPDGKVFISSSSVTVPGAGVVNGSIAPGQSSPVEVVAENSGDGYNEAPARYSIAGQPMGIYGQGNQMSGGTSKVITVVTQGDIDKAKNELLAKDKEASKLKLDEKAGSEYQILSESFAQEATEVTSDPALDQEASTAVLTLKVKYSELSVLKEDFKRLVAHHQEKQIGPQNQIYDDGAETAKLTLGKKEADGTQGFHFSAEAYGGAKLDTAAIAKELRGKRYGDALDYAKQLPGIEEAQVELKPGWNPRLPRLTKNIRIEIRVAGLEQTTNN